MGRLICWLFHRRRWYATTSTFYGVPGFDEAERNTSNCCSQCRRGW